MGFLPGMENSFNIPKSVTIIYHINRIKKHIIFSILCTKLFYKTPHPFMIKKTLSKPGVEENFLILTKGPQSPV